MLTLMVPGLELFDETTYEIRTMKEQKIQLEHSLISVSRWEAKWHEAFLTDKPKTREQMIDYIRCMSVSNVLDDDFYNNLPDNILLQINDYIENPMSATTIHEQDSFSRSIITSEIIYYWMIELGIPFECQKWHLNRLMKLIRVCSIKRSPDKKMSKKEILQRNRELNEARRAKMNTKG